MSAPNGLSPNAEKAFKLWEEGCVQNHNAFVSKYRQRQRAYHAIVDERTDAADGWHSKIFPPFVGHILESSLASIVDSKLTFRVKPRPRLYDPAEYQLATKGAEAHEILHNAQLKQDRFHETQQPFALQDAIAGLTVAKNYWRRDIRIKPQLKVVNDEGAAAMGQFLPRLVEVEEPDICYDGPTTEVVNVEDFFWHESATELQKSPVIAHRVWMHFNDLKRLEQQGIYKNVDELKGATDSSGQYVDQRVTDGTSRSKDMIAVLEIWWREPDGIHTVTIGNNSVELAAAKKNPFWHGEYPFVACSTRPDLFSITGKSQVEKIMDLQQGHWDLYNQMIDNVRLQNNAIFLLGEDVLDPDNLEFAPGAKWLVEGNPNDMMKSWSPDPQPSQIALPHLGHLEQMMQNLAGGYPFTSTSEAASAGADTATAAALSTNLAERATVRLKEQLTYAYERIGQQRTELNQQFLRVPVMVEQIGLDSEAEFTQIAPFLLQGSYLFDVSPMVESLARSERRAEANSMFQTFLQAAAVWVAMAQSGSATPPNFDEFAKQWLESYDVGPTERFFSKRAPQQPIPGPGGGQQPQGPPQGAPGITAPQATAPTSPSSQGSLSPESHMQRLMAQQGGVSNT